MVQRVLIGDMNGGVGTADMRIRMSRPGYDVMSSLDPEQLAFDSSWLDTSVIYMMGSVAVPTPPFGTGYIQVNFADTLPSLPQVIVYRLYASNAMSMGSDKSTNQNWGAWFCRFSTTYLRFEGSLGGTSGAGEEPYTAGYIVLRGLS